MPSPRSGDERRASLAGSSGLIQLGDAAFAVALAFASYFAISSFAVADRDPQSSSEGLFLAVWTAAVVGAIAIWGGRRATWTAVAVALAVTTVIWAVGTGYLRGAIVGALLGAALAVTVMVRESRREGWLALSFGSQLLIRSDMAVLPIDRLELVVHWLLIPLTVGLCLDVLARRYGHDRAMIAALIGMILGPGWTVSVSAAVLALAGGCLLGDSAGDAVKGRWTGALMLALVAFLGPGAGVVPFLGGLTIAARGKTRMLLIVATVVTAAVALASLGNRGMWMPISDALLAVALVPIALLVPRAVGVHGLVLVIAAATLSPDKGTLAVGSMLWVLAGPTSGAVVVFQRWWSACLALLVAVAAAYPWMRPVPVSDIRELLGLEHPLVFVMTGWGLVVVVGLIVERARLRLRVESFAMCIAMVGLIVAFVPHRVEVLERPLEERPAMVGADQREFLYQVATDALIGAVVIDAALINGVAVPERALVGRLRALDLEGRELAGANLRAGLNIADWSQDVDGDDLHRRVPRHWMTFMPPGSAGLGRRYRVRLELPRLARVGAVEVSAQGGLGSEAQLVVYRMELRR